MTKRAHFRECINLPVSSTRMSEHIGLNDVRVRKRKQVVRKLSGWLLYRKSLLSPAGPSSAPVPHHNAGPAEAPCPLTALAMLGEHSQPGSRAPAYGGQTEGVAFHCGPPAAATLSSSSVEPIPRALDMRSYCKGRCFTARAH